MMCPELFRNSRKTVFLIFKTVLFKENHRRHIWKFEDTIKIWKLCGFDYSTTPILSCKIGGCFTFVIEKIESKSPHLFGAKTWNRRLIPGIRKTQSARKVGGHNMYGGTGINLSLLWIIIFYPIVRLRREYCMKQRDTAEYITVRHSKAHHITWEYSTLNRAQHSTATHVAIHHSKAGCVVFLPAPAYLRTVSALPCSGVISRAGHGMRLQRGSDGFFVVAYIANFCSRDRVRERVYIHYFRNLRFQTLGDGSILSSTNKVNI